MGTTATALNASQIDMSKRNVFITFVENVIKADKFPDDGSPVRHDLPPGAAVWVKRYGSEEIGALDITCPCGCGYVHSITIRPAGTERPSWEWDGNKEKPTLQPSLLMKTPCGWHGYLRAGNFEEC